MIPRTGIAKLWTVGWLLAAILAAPVFAQTSAICPISAAAGNHAPHACCCDGKGDCQCGSECGAYQESTPESQATPPEADAAKLLHTLILADFSVADEPLKPPFQAAWGDHYVSPSQSSSLQAQHIRLQI